MRINPEPTLAAWKGRYEALRRLAVGAKQMWEVQPLGLVLLLRQGVAGWMSRWPELAEQTRGAPLSEPVLIPARQQELTQLLAAMSLAHLERTHL
jgi:hypothetical protein